MKSLHHFYISCLQILAVWLLLILRAHAEPIISVDHADFIAPLQPYLQVWVPDQTIDIATASDPANSAQFQAVKSIAIAAIGRDVWYRFELQATAEFAQRLVVAFEQTKYQEVDFYIPSKDGWQVSKIGLARPYDQRPLDYRFLASPLFLEPNHPTVIYFRILSLRGIAVAPLLQSDTMFFGEAVEYSILSGLIIGALSALLIYVGLVSRLTLRNAQLFWLLAFISSCLFSTLYYDGYFASNIETNRTVTEIIPFLIPSFLNITALMFCRYLFDMPKKMPALNRLLVIPIAGYIGLSILAFIITTSQLPSLITRSLTMVALLMLAAISVRAIMLRITGCYYYAIGILFYTAAGVIIILSSVGFWSLPATGRILLSASTVAQTLFFSIAALQLLSTTRQRELSLEKSALAANTRAEVQNGFLISMSHEIRTPINGVLGMAQMLDKTTLDSTQRYYLEILSSAGKTLLSVINEILDFSKIEAGKLDIESIYFDVDHTLLCSAGLFGQSSVNENVEFSFQTSPNVPIHLLGDPTRLQQIVNNLLSNAAKFTEAGSIATTISLVEQSTADKVVLRFTVSDSGIGMSESHVEKLFVPFSQAEKSTTRHYGGTGLGLAISKQLVELMGGSIHVQSTLGKGTTFWFDLPFKIAAQEQKNHDERTRNLKDKHIAWCVRSPAYVENYSNALRRWGAFVHFIDPDSAAADVDWGAMDVLIVSNALTHAQLIHWINAAKQQSCHILLLEAYGSGTTESYDATVNSVLHLPRPAGFSRLAEYLFKAMQDQQNPTLEPQHTRELPLAGLHLLVAEDNEVNIKVLQALFKKYQIEADFVVNGQLAIEVFCANPSHYDAILMDCDMPVLDGFAACRGIRQFEQEHDLARIKIIALTAHALQETHEQCLASGMDEILTKPTNFPALLSLLGQLTRRSKRPTITITDFNV
jgi:signal transduction histidine kinase/ActR/RegA family two-component response regulator